MAKSILLLSILVIMLATIMGCTTSKANLTTDDAVEQTEASYISQRVSVQAGLPRYVAVPMGTGETLEGHFTIQAQHRRIWFRIENAYGTVVYGPVLAYNYHSFEVYCPSGGWHKLYFENLFDTETKLINLYFRHGLK